MHICLTVISVTTFTFPHHQHAFGKAMSAAWWTKHIPSDLDCSDVTSQWCSDAQPNGEMSAAGQFLVLSRTNTFAWFVSVLNTFGFYLDCSLLCSDEKNCEASRLLVPLSHGVCCIQVVLDIRSFCCK